MVWLICPKCNRISERSSALAGLPILCTACRCLLQPAPGPPPAPPAVVEPPPEPMPAPQLSPPLPLLPEEAPRPAEAPVDALPAPTPPAPPAWRFPWLTVGGLAALLLVVAALYAMREAIWPGAAPPRPPRAVPPGP